MRRSLITAALALVVLVWPARAQLFPTPSEQPAPPVERVVMDAVFWTVPVTTNDTCIELTTGLLAVTVKLEGAGPAQPVGFALDAYRYGELDPDARIRVDATREVSTVRVPLHGGRYCYALLNRAIVPPGFGDGSAGPVTYAQNVALRMTFTPQ